ncbi:MAG: helix-turn-helix transcriptional regulator [Clostridia bacterium]|nr:helix-turn-helix transcriptional regulator [Clostridia bacterium]
MDIPQIIAKNITALRKNAGMTQAGLAEKIGYSDKSISKWERADGIPDVICLKAIADLFGVTVDYMLTEDHPAEPEAAAPAEEPQPPQKTYTTSHIAVTLVSVAGVWLLAFAVYIILRLCDVSFGLGFAVALPVTAILLIVFNALWGNRRLGFWCITLLVWSLLFLICYAARSHDIWLLMCIGFPATVVVWLSCRVRSPKPEENKNTEENE